MHIGGFNYTNFSAINLKNTAAIRLNAGAISGTISIKEEGLEVAREWKFPDKTGNLMIGGTFTVNLPAVSANDILDTNVIVPTGVRTGDAMVVSIQNMTTTGIGTRGYVFIGGCQVANGGVNLTFVNATDTATIYKDIVVAYAATR